MATKTKKAGNEIPVNNNVNTNNNTIHVHNYPLPKTPGQRNAKKKKEPDWIKKSIIIGLIGLALSLCGYYIKQNLNKGTPTTQPGATPIEGNKLN